MPMTQKAYCLVSTTRTDIRNELIKLFLEEIPGTGTGDKSSKYEYIVETYSTYNISLNRPALLNKGFDFTVSVLSTDSIFFKNRSYNTPSHNDVMTALKYFKTKSPEKYPVIKKLLYDIFNCYKIDLSSSISLGSFKDYKDIEHPIEIILLAIKWLFIEQDITYWNWSGRQMLWNHLTIQGLV